MTVPFFMASSTIWAYVENMEYAVEWNFDDSSEQKIITLWEKLDAVGIETIQHLQLKPHITLGIGEADNLEELCARFEPICSIQKPFPVTFNHIGIFPNKELVLYLGVNITEAILESHAAINDILLRFLRDPWKYYLPGNWTPHCTISDKFKDSDIIKGLEIVKTLPLPMTVMISRISVHTVTPVNYLKSISFSS